MQIWKLQACRDEERIGCRWGYVIADTEGEALAAARRSARLPFVLAHPMRPEMQWPGGAAEQLYWSS